ncbi:YukJ family protein [Paenibacillus tritici]|uniref:YukJ family protein n=1 Tax=Paenibacillus tritici TaxID=1873425 RepID=UPI001BAACB33|nr:YukJ family protein [Paenibacillus tritici]QUL55461.1 YukJ family protein [Paenibacillus tritici]
MGNGFNRGYGVLKCKLSNEETIYKLGDKNNHIEVLAEDDFIQKYRLAINIQSSEKAKHLPEDTANQVLYYVGEDFKSDETARWLTLESGFTEITRDNRNLALDYIRGNLVIPNKMVALPNTNPNETEDSDPHNNLYDKITSYLKEAQEQDATLYVFGEPWGPEEDKPDKYFGFTPGRGVHNIHMNQGNAGGYARENGAWQDGGVLIHFENERRWVAIFLAFQSQSWCTNDQGDATKPVSECNHTNALS